MITNRILQCYTIAMPTIQNINIRAEPEKSALMEILIEKKMLEVQHKLDAHFNYFYFKEF